jgi:photosystem II stability/assembly factor-like uncharacterized protein
MFLKSVKGVILIFFLFITSLCYGETNKFIDRSGLSGEGLISLAVDPVDSEKLYIGTDKGLYEKEGEQKDWNLICGESCGLGQVNQIAFDPATNDIYSATNKGLFCFTRDKKECKAVFIRSDELERECLAAIVLKNGTIFIGTAGGLFISRNKGKNWQKISSPFEKEKIVSLFGNASLLYAATPSYVYKTLDSGKTWIKIFNIYFYKENAQEDESSSTDPEEISQQPIKYIVGDVNNPQKIYVATNKGIFISQEAGKNWDRLPLEGLDSVTLKFLMLYQPQERLFAVTKSGLFELKNNRWVLSVMAYDCRQIVQKGRSLVLITFRDIFEYDASEIENSDESMIKEDLKNLFDNEPTVEQVQEMAIDYAEVSDKKIKDWRRKAATKALLPEFSVDFDRSVSTSVGATYERSYVGPMDWGLSLKWDLANIVYTSDQTSIDSRSKLMVELRNDVLAEVTRLYFERRKLQMELESRNATNSEGNIDKKLRMMELTALINRLTGGQFSKMIKS